MNAESKIRELVTAHLSDNHNVDGIQFIDRLLWLAFEVGEIDCRLTSEGKLRFRIPDRAVCDVELDRAKAKLRLLCARLGVLCRESGAQVSIYGGEGIVRKEVAVEQPDPSDLVSGSDLVRTGAISVVSSPISRAWIVRFKNTLSEHQFTIQPSAR
jgi:hypothetical protein